MVKRGALVISALLCGVAQPHAQDYSQFSCQMSGEQYTCQFNPQKGQSMLTESWISDEEVYLKKVLKSKKKKGGSNPIVDFLLGILMITCAFPIIWMNERRQVRTWQLIKKAEDSVKEIKDPNEVDEGLDLELVHIEGEIKTEDEVADAQFPNITKTGTLVLKRVVSIYKVERTEDDNGNTEVKEFWDEQILENGNQDTNQSFYVENATLGAYTVSKHSLELLHDYKDLKLEDYPDIGEAVMAAFSGQKFKVHDEEVVVRVSHDEDDHDREGDFKVSWKYIPADKDYTIMAQQMKNDKEATSFRQWNPERLDVPWGEDNGSSTESSDFCLSSPCCLVSSCVEKCFKSIFQEVIHVVEPGKKSVGEIIDDLNAGNAGLSKVFRCVGWLFLVVGNFLLFSPIIALLKWIPLVGWLLGGIFAIAVAIWSFIFGSIVFMITLTIAWLFYRPLFGLALLFGVGVLITICFTVGA